MNLHSHVTPGFFPDTRALAANRILSALPPEEYNSLATDLETVRLPFGKVLYRPDEPVTHVYFPNCAIVSITSVLSDGGSVEVGMVGNEGMLGLNVILGSHTAPLEAIVQVQGDGLRMRADLLRKEFKKGRHLQDLLLRYTQSLIVQVSQAAACNRFHRTEGRLARWLLMCQDRTMTCELELTHEFIAMMLGVRRASVTEVARQFQARGVIKYRHGRITIIDRRGLESISCECYSIVKKEFACLISSGNARTFNEPRPPFQVDFLSSPVRSETNSI